MQGVEPQSVDRSPRSARRAVGPRLDVVCIVRGGGARTDLAASTERRSRARSRLASVAVLTGIGHEIDTTVADAVAHRNFRTPTACAVALVEHVTRWCDRLNATWNAIARAASQSPARTRRGARRVHTTSRDVSAPRPSTEPDGVSTPVEAHVRALDPVRSLARGWTITHDGDGRLVRSTADVGGGSELVTTFADGEVRSTVDG